MGYLRDYLLNHETTYSIVTQRILINCLLATLTTVLFMGCASAVKVTRVKDMEKPAPGVYYALPRTVFVIEVPVTNTVFTPGKFAKFAEEFGFGTNDLTLASTSFSLGEISLRAASEPDPSNVFHVRIQGNFFEDRSLSLELNQAGLLSSASGEADNRVIDYTVQTIETVAGAIGAAIKFSGVSATSSNAQTLKLEIDDIRKRRFDLLSGKAQPGVSLPADSLKLSLDELNKMERTLASHFTGTAKIRVWTARFEIRPVSTNLDPITLLYLNEKTGVSGLNTNLSVNPLPVEFSISPTTGSKVVLKLALAPSASITSALKAKAPNTSGYFYRRPVPVVASLEHGEKLLTRHDVMVAQFGPVLSLPSSTASKSSKQQITLFTDTGSLRTVTVGSKSWDPAQVNKLGTAAGSILSNEGELAELERRRKILEERLKIKEAQDALAEDSEQ
jgi:hypothetical protein